MVNPLPGSRRNTYHRSIFKKCPFQFTFDVILYQLQPFFIHKVALIQNNNALFYSQDPQDVHMFSRLRHNSLICRDDKHHKIHAHNTCNHVINEFFMPRHINNPDPVSILQVKISESKVNRDSPALFFFPPVSIPSRQCFNQRRLTMIYMTCSSYDNMFHNYPFYRRLLFLL